MTLIFHDPAASASDGSPLILAFACPWAQVAVGLQPSAFGPGQLRAVGSSEDFSYKAATNFQPSPDLTDLASHKAAMSFQSSPVLHLSCRLLPSSIHLSNKC